MYAKRTALLGLALSLAVTPLVSGCDAISAYLNARSAAVEWQGDIPEIAFQKLDKDGKVFDIELHSRIDHPPATVWGALQTPQNLADNSEQYKKSELIEDKGNVKILDFHVMALDNLQAFKVEMTFDEPGQTVAIKTIEASLADIDGIYELHPSPDGTKTLYVYKAKQTDKVALPISTDVQRSAIKESFVNQVRAIKKQIEG